jgi:D-alanyl-lipoteichoic acid acyltransferase DltB (MBOAT superfamily)
MTLKRKKFKKRRKKSLNIDEQESINNNFYIYESMDTTNLFIGTSVIILGFISYYIDNVGDKFLLPAALCSLCIATSDFIAVKINKKRNTHAWYSFYTFLAIASLVLMPTIIVDIPSAEKFLKDFEKPITFIALGLTISTMGFRKLSRKVEETKELAAQIAMVSNRLKEHQEKENTKEDRKV